MNIINKNRIINMCLLFVSMIILIAIVILKEDNNEKTSNSYKESSSITQEKLAVYINSEGEYIEYEGSAWPSGYDLNTDLSKCLDVNKNVIDNAFTYTDGVFKLTTNTTAYCYLYFDEITA